MTLLQGALALLLLFPIEAVAAPPAWAVRNTQRIQGNFYHVVCSGIGPSISLARQDAIDGCKSSAAQQLEAEVLVKSMSVISEREGAYQQEVSHSSRVTGLVCVPRREEIEETEARVRLWVLCEFDLSKARAIRELSAEGGPADSRWAGQGRTDSSQVLTLAVVPRCTDLLIRGRGPARVIRCDRNPISIVLGPSDREVLVRSTGRMPKSIPLKTARGAREYTKVVLDPLVR